MKHSTKKKILHDVIRYGYSVFIAHVVVFFGGIVVANMLGPSDFGLWKALQLGLGYSIYLGLGAINAINREVPYFQGKGKLDRVNNIRNVALGHTLVVSLAVPFGVIFLYYFFPSVFPLSPLLILFVCALFFLQQIYAYFETLFKSSHNFKMVSKLRLSRTVMDLGMAIVFICFFNLNGRLLALSLTFIFVLIYIIKISEFPLKPEIDIRETLKLLKIGFPILMVGFSGTLYFTIDSMLVLKFLDRIQLGYYSVAMVFASLILVLTGVMSEVLYPRYAERYGSSGSISSLKLYVMVPNLLMAYGFSLIIGIAILLLPMAIMIFLPSYFPTIILAKIILFGAVFQALAKAPGNFLNTINRQNTNLIINGAGLIALFLLIYIFIIRGYGIVGVAIGATIGHFMVSTFRIVFVIKGFFEDHTNTLDYLLDLYAPIGFVLLLILLVEQTITTDSSLTLNNISMLTLKMIVFIVGYGIFFFLMSRKIHLVSEIKNIIAVE